MPNTEKPDSPTPDEGPPPQRKRGDFKRNDRLSNLFWYAMGALVLGAIFFSVMSNRQAGEPLAFSDLMAGLESDPPRFNDGNVFKLIIGTNYITFQDQPEAAGTDAHPQMRKYLVPAVGMD